MSDVQPTGAETVTWDLSDLYAAIDDPAIDRDLDLSDAEADALGEKYRGRVAGLSAAELAEMLAAYETLLERAYKVGNFGHLSWSADTSVPAYGALLQKVTERGSRLEPEARLHGAGAGGRARRCRRRLAGRPGRGAIPALARTRAPLPPAHAHRAGREDPGGERRSPDGAPGCASSMRCMARRAIRSTARR